MRAVAFALIALLVVACSQGLALGDYVDEMEAATDAYITESQGLSVDYQGTVEDAVRDLVASGVDDPEAEAVDLVRIETVRYLALLTDAMERYRFAIEDIEPSGAVAADHDAYVAAVALVVDSLPQTRDSVETASSFEEIQLALASSGFADGQLRWTAACTDLEQAVRDEGRGLDLRCVVQVTP